MAAKRVTIFDPPPLDDSKAPIENVLELTPILDIGPVRYAQGRLSPSPVVTLKTKFRRRE